MTVFSQRPSENQDPWYANINSYFASIEYEIRMRPRISRGYIPDGDDLNTYVGVEHAGVWRLNPTSTYINGPPNQSTQTSMLVIDITNASVVQTEYGYNSISYRQRPSGAWGAWRQLALAEDTKHIKKHAPLTPSSDLDALDDGWYPIWYVGTAQALGLPGRIGTLKVETIIDPGQPDRRIRIQKYETNQGSIMEGFNHPFEVWMRGMDHNRVYESEFKKVFPPLSDSIVSDNGPSHSSGIASEAGETNKCFQKDADSVKITKSTMKLMTLLGLRRIVGNNVNELVTVTAGDSNPGGSGGITYQVGDRISFEDLAYGMMLPSSNWSSNIIARAAGEKLPGEGDGYSKFMNYVQGIADSEGWDGAVIADASGLSNSNRLSPNMLNELVYLFKSDAWAKTLTTTSSHTITIQGPNEREIRVTHGFDLDTFPEMILVKTGSGAGYYNVAALWETRTGVLCATSIIGSSPTQRNLDLRYVIDLTKKAFDKNYMV